MPRARPAIQASHSKRWRTPKNRYQNIPANVKTTARARVVANIRVGTAAKEKEAAQPMEASQSSNQVLAIHIGGCLGQGTASVLSRLLGAGPAGQEWSDRREPVYLNSLKA